MLITLIIILLLIGAAVVGSIYSNFLVFYSNFGESENYHKAYYASISALERGELVVKQRGPGYEGVRGIKQGILQGPVTHEIDGYPKRGSGGYLSSLKNNFTIIRDIKSRTKRIPTEGKGDVEEMLAAGDSSNYNMMNYENAEIFLLYNDTLSGNQNPYTGSNTSEKVKVNIISGEIRLPAYLRDKFGYLNTGKSLIGISNALPADDAIVDRQIKGQYNSGGTRYPFTIYSTPSLKIGGGIPKVNYNEDSVFRESDINRPLQFKFGNDAYMLCDSGKGGSPLGRSHKNNRWTYIGQTDAIKKIFNNICYSFETFNTHNNTQNLQLRFSLLNLVEGFDGMTGRVYPYLEYYADFGGKEVPDKYFTINAEGAFKDYQVNTIVQKPTIKESILGSFTSIF